MIELIPAIDIIDGRCVRLTKGDYATERVYSEQPVDMAKAFEDFGSGGCTWWTLTARARAIS